MTTRVVTGRAGLVREIRSAAPLFSAVRGPVTARPLWLTGAAGVTSARVHAVLVESPQQGRPRGVALLASRRWGPVTSVRMLGDDVPLPAPPGSPSCNLPVVDPDAADDLARGVLGLLDAQRGRWVLKLTGLPLGDPVLQALAGQLGTGASFSTDRTRVLVDGLDALGDVHRSADPADLERWLPALLDRRPSDTRSGPLRAAARLHATVGLLEHAVVVRDGRVVAGLVTLLDGDTRRPWWGTSDVGGIDTVPGQPTVSFTASTGSTKRRRSTG